MRVNSINYRYNSGVDVALTYRYDEIKYFSNGEISIYIADIKNERIQAILNIIRTLFVSIILLVGSLFFANDIYNIILIPIERMIEKVNMLATNP
jgi:hypothetical protein